VLAALLSARVGAVLEQLGWLLLEPIGRLLDRPTSLVVGGYVTAVALTAVLEVTSRRRSRQAAVLWQPSCFLSILGQGYVVALSWKLLPTATVVGALALVALHFFRPAAWCDKEAEVLPRAPIVTVFVLLHVLLEGTAGHILTPWQGELTRALAATSSAAPFVHGLASLVTVVTPLLVLVFAVRRGLAPVSWLHFDLRRVVDALAPISLLALSLVGFHYMTVTLDCPAPDGAERRLLSSEGGVFDLDLSADGQIVAVSHREAQFVELIDRSRAVPLARVDTHRPSDTLFDRTEPETILGLEDGQFLLLLASSDTESGNALALLDPGGAGLSPPLPASGVSDVVSDGAGSVWVASEFSGLLGWLAMPSGSLAEYMELPEGAETNKVVVDGSIHRAWSAGLWSDPMLRLVDTEQGVQLAETEVGTHQWDLARSAALERIYVAKLVAGAVRVFDAKTLEEVMQIEDEFGLRPIEVGPQGRVVVAGNLYTGDVVGWDGATGGELFRESIGGYIKSLKIDADGRVVAGSICGTWELSPPSLAAFYEGSAG